MTRLGCLQDDLARSGGRLQGGLRSLLMAGTSDASGVWLIGNPGRYGASVMVCDSCVNELGARAQNAQQVVGDPSSCLVIVFTSVHVFLHGIQNAWTCPRTAWLPTVRGHVTHVGQPAQGVSAFILFSSVCCGDAMHWCARTHACTQFSNVRVDIHDRGAGEGCQLTLVQDSIPSKCVEAADRYQRPCYRFPLSPSAPLPPRLTLSLSRSLALSAHMYEQR